MEEYNIALHEKSVQALSQKIKEFHAAKKPFYIYHGSSSSTRRSQFKRSNSVDTSKLNNVIFVDEDKRIARVQSNVPMELLARASLKKGLVPEVVMDFYGITVGGGHQGLAGDTSSHRFGPFHETISSFEMILGNGDIVKVDAQSDPELFCNSPGTFGTLGVLTQLDVRLIPAKKYVEVDFQHYNDARLAVSKTASYGSGPDMADYLECYVFSPTSVVVMPGKLTDTAVTKPQQFTRRGDPWYYMYARTAKGKVTVPLWDYLFRHDRGAFWGGQFAMKHFHVPNNRISRWALDHWLRVTPMYHALQVSGLSQRYTIQDLLLPDVQAAELFLEDMAASQPHYPLLIAVGKISYRPAVMSNELKFSPEKRLVSIGLYGSSYKTYEEFREQNLMIEDKLRAYDGAKWLYAQTFGTEEDFWKALDRDLYNKMRQRCGAENLPNIWDKTGPEPPFKRVSGLRGFWSVLTHANHLISD